MIYHNLDFKILIGILNGKKISEVAKSFDWCDVIPKDKKQQERYLRNKYNIILRRLDKMEKDGLILITGNGNNKDYGVISNNVILKKIKCPDGKLRNCLWIKEIDSDWQMYCV